MSKTLPVVNTAIDTFGNFVIKTNSIITALDTEIVTANSLANGAWTSGNGWVNGYFGANSIVVGTLRGGFLNALANVSVASNLVFSSASLFNGIVTVNSTMVGVGANALINSSSFFVGNATVNAVLSSSVLTIGISTTNSTTMAVGANAILTSSSLTLGNSTVNTFANSTSLTTTSLTANSLAVGSNVSVNTSTLFVGNSTVNASFNSSGFTSNSVTVNGTVIAVGANLVINTTAFRVGNSTVNASLTATGYTSGIVSTNASAITIGANLTINSSGMTIGNSTVNLMFNSTSVTLSGTSLALANSIVFLAANNGTLISTRQKLNFIQGNNVTLSISDDAGGGQANVIIDAGITGINTTSSYTTTNTDVQTIDSWTFATWRSAEYLISVKNNAANAYQTTKLLLVHDGGSSYVTEYGQIFSNTSLGTYSTTANATHVLLQFSPGAANSTLKWFRWTIAN